MKTPFLRRPFDVILVAFFVVSIAYGWLFSLPEGLGFPVTAESPWPPLRALYDWAVANEPAHLDPPPQLIASCLFDAFFQAPILTVIIYALVHQRPWLRAIAPIYAAAAVTNMYFYFFETFMGPHPPGSLAIYLSMNLPWLIAPIALVFRVRSDEFAT